MPWKRGSRLKLVDEVEAPATTRLILQEVRELAGLPAAPLLYRAYAAYPRFLEQHWEAFRRLWGHREFFALASRLVAESYTRVHNYFSVTDLSGWLKAPDAIGQSQLSMPLIAVLDYYQYVDPLSLLVAAAQVQAFEGPIGEDMAERTAGAQRPAFTDAPSPLPETQASAPTLRMWEERRRLLGGALVSEEHHALARWPGFYRDYWLALRQLVQSPIYNDSRHRIAESAWNLLRELPLRIETSVPQMIESGLSEDDVSSLLRINEAMVRGLSGVLLDVIYARIALEGGTQGTGTPRNDQSFSSLPSEPKHMGDGPTGSPTKAA